MNRQVKVEKDQNDYPKRTKVSKKLLKVENGCTKCATDRNRNSNVFFSILLFELYSFCHLFEIMLDTSLLKDLVTLMKLFRDIENSQFDTEECMTIK